MRRPLHLLHCPRRRRLRHLRLRPLPAPTHRNWVRVPPQM